MIVLDACAVVALMRDEPAAAAVGELVQHGATLTAVGETEVLDHMIRFGGVDEDEAVLQLGILGLLEPILVDDFVGTRAGILRARHHHRRSCAVSTVDCIAAEAARWHNVPLATSDPHLLDVCHAETIMVHPLPDSTGAVWSPQ